LQHSEHYAPGKGPDLIKPGKADKLAHFWTLPWHLQVLHTTRVCNFSEQDALKAGLDAGAELKASARPGFFMW